MKNSLAAAALLAMLLTGCSTSPTPEEEKPQARTTNTAPAAASPSATPIGGGAEQTPEPATLEEAITAAKQEHATVPEALHAMSVVRRFANDELRPLMSTQSWGELLIDEINAELAILKDELTVRQATVAAQRFAASVESEALEQGLIR